MAPFGDAYRGRRVLVTGHTGFKGSWLTSWLVRLGASVTGFSLGAPSSPCHFDLLSLGGEIEHRTGDVRDLGELASVFDRARPEVVFHLAAQALIRRSYEEPKLTFDTNLGGTVNVLEAIRQSASVRAAVLVTSDKCYLNREWAWAYRENDTLGGEDPYSASKACAELAAQAYMRSFLRQDGGGVRPRAATARAGNVVGGGDWASDRIVPDCVRAWSEGKPVLVRSPGATRPWQHVLEPVSGYLWLGASLLAGGRFHGEAFNFGPSSDEVHSVENLIGCFAEHWPGAAWRLEGTLEAKKENVLLRLSCDKALHHLGWRATLSFAETVRLTAEWYRAFYEDRGPMRPVTERQIDCYVARAREQALPWAAGGSPA